MTQPMTLGATFLAEFDQEMANTRRMLERVPDDRLAWRPHAKSWPLVDLAVHLATIPAWGVVTLETESLDLASPEAQAYAPPEVRSRQGLLELFDQNVARVHAAIAGASDEQLLKPWTLRKGEQTLLTLPRIAILKAHTLNHSIHHRAQLGMYLRLLDVPVPGMYGPSADEQGM